VTTPTDAVTAPPTVGCPEAEAAVLGALLRMPHPDAVALADRLEPADFVDPRHRAVFGAVTDLLAEGVTADPVTVLGELRRSGAERSMTADRSAGAFLADLLAAAPAVPSAGHYARVVIEHRARRRLHEAAERLSQVAGAACLTTVREVALDEWTAIIGQLDRVTAGARRVVT
jgi:replicative DNA helicase